MKSDILNGIKKNDKLALFYVNINDKRYYYSYNRYEDSLSDIYDSYRVVDYKKAEILLTNQINEA